MEKKVREEQTLKLNQIKILIDWLFDMFQTSGMTGIDNKKIQSFDGLTQVQKTTRVEWIVKELIEG